MASIETILINRHRKDEMISFLDKHPNQFEKAIEISLTNDEHQAWRAAWLIGHCMTKNDERIQPYVKKIITSIKTKKDGHQRELLKVLEKTVISQNLEGDFFDTCVDIWKSVNKSPSVRIVSFRILVQISKRYPALRNELMLLTENYYTDTLTPGVKASFNNLIKV